MRKEVKLITQAHGPSVPGQENRQLTEFNRGCIPNGGPHPVDAVDGCIDVQYSVHRAPSCRVKP